MAKVIKAEKEPEDREFTFYLPWDDPQVRRMIVKEGHKVSMVEDADWDIALFTGGPDICPLLYGEKMDETTNIHITRDLREIQFYKGLHHRRMKVGICRGAQLLNVLSGGRLWQDVNGHARKDGHLVKVYDSQALIRMSSRHHQMMIPASNAMILGSASESTRKQSETKGVEERTVAQLSFSDPEIIYYEYTHSLCFQPHPEDEDDMCRKKFFEYISLCWSDAFYQQSMTEWE